MRFAILGALEVEAGGRQVPLRGPQQRVLLSVLLLNANRVVSTDRLVECLWNEHPPAAARSLLQGCVAQLRRTLRSDHDPGQQPLVTRAPGYCLQVAAGELDLDRFERLVAAADDPAIAGPESAALLDQALSLWRGPALDGVALDACQADLARLEERRLEVLERRIDLELRLGRHASLVGELEVLARGNPLRERFWAQLMLAQYAGGRQAESLATYQRLRRTLVEQLGVEPGPMTRQLQAAILSGADAARLFTVAGGEMAAAAVQDTAPAGSDDEPAPAPARTTPAQLPPSVVGFTGRSDYLTTLDRLLMNADDAAAVGVVSGTAGVGKTALVVHWAHRVRQWFGDGQLYVNLRGFAPAPPVRPIEALAGFLQALGTPAEQIPVEVDQATALYRTLLAGKRMLVVLDNARSAEQVRPLLPGTAGCLVLVTSRDRLGGLVARDGAHHLTLGVLDDDEAVALLTHMVGANRVEPEPEAAAELVRRCGRLPLALRIAAANLSVHPKRRLAEQVARLADGDRLSALEVDDDRESTVRAAFGLSYDVLDQPARILFRRLGLAPGPDVTAPAAAALADTTADQAAKLLNTLSRAHLVHQDERDRFAVHDLLCLYAAERVHQEDDAAERDAALGRLFDWYLTTADAAARLLYPDALRLPLPTTGTVAGVRRGTEFADHAAALAWLEAELVNLVATIQYAAEHGPHAVSWLLADTLRGYFMLQVLPIEWQASAGAALSAARAADVPRAQMAAELSLAGSHQRQNRDEQAIEHYHRALAVNEVAGWAEGESTALGNLGTVYMTSGRLREAADHLARALEVDRRIGWLGGQAVKLGNLGIVSRRLGRLEAAAAQLSEVRDLFGQLGSRHGEALADLNLGVVLHQLGRQQDAADQLTRALALTRELGDRASEADALNMLALIHREGGRLLQALDLAGAGLELAVDVGERHYEAEAHAVLGSVHLRLGDVARAEDHHRRALAVARTSHARDAELEALIGLADISRRHGDAERARRYADEAVALAAATGYRVLEGQALVSLANAVLDLGRNREAAGLAARAVDLQRDTGYRLGALNALVALGHALARSDRDGARTQ